MRKKILLLAAIAVYPAFAFATLPSVSSQKATSRSAGADVVRDSGIRTGRSVVVTSDTSGTRASSLNRSAVTQRSGSTAVRNVSTAGSVVSGRQQTSAAARYPSAVVAARSAVSTPSRANVARATALFTDVSKLGGAYATCRETYNTCMDQFCGAANDTYRRCICSDKYTDFSTTESALSQAKSLLMEFNDSNLEAVDKTTGEVSAMYSATIGEDAIKKDTTASAKLLSQVSDLLSGKTTAQTSTLQSSLDKLVSVDFSSDLGDIWSGDESTWDQTNTNLSELEGTDLYNEVNSQCSEMAQESCSNDNQLAMVRSAYSMLISQDCGTYEKSLDKQKESVESTVRDAYNVLREARLDEYRSHNSTDMNACVDAVRTALTADSACGEGYKRCMDYTGQYISQTTGEPIYSPTLYKLEDQIDLSYDTSDVLSKNRNFETFLDSKKMYAESALDTCQGIADDVWEEFKRTALIEIAQAQSEKIAEIKDSCVSTMKDCYDTQTSALASFDDTSAQRAGSTSASAASAMCKEKVIACANLYTPSAGTACTFNSRGQVTNADNCGLTQLLSFVSTVDSVRVEEGCQTALTNYVADLCKPASSDSAHSSPYGCRSLELGSASDSASTTLYGTLNSFAKTYCEGSSTASLGADTQRVVASFVSDIADEISYMLSEDCNNYKGLWIDESVTLTGVVDNTAYASGVFGGRAPVTDWGRCVQYSQSVQCDDPGVTCNPQTGEVTLDEDWYQYICGSVMGGYWDTTASSCYYIP